MNSIIIRPMTFDDIDAVHQIEVACFKKPWSKDAFYQELRENVVAVYMVACAGDVVVGYGGMWMIINEAHITNVAVRDDYRSQGIGRNIILKLQESAKELMGISNMTLEVRVSNSIAIKLYESMGFKTAGIRPKYYEDNKEDAYIMWCDISAK